MWWAEISKTIKLRLEKRKNIFFPAFHPDVPYLPFSLNTTFHIIEKCSIVKTISIITCWRSLPELFVIFPCLGLCLLKALVNVKKKHREHLDSVLSTSPNATKLLSNRFPFAQMTEQILISIYIYIYIYIYVIYIYIYIYIYILGKKPRDYDTYISLRTVLWDFRD